MNRKILNVSLFATLMLTIPMTSVVGVSDVNGDCGCQVENKNNRVSSIICDLLNTILINVMEKGEIYLEKYEDALESGNMILANLYYILVCLCFPIVNYIFFIGENLGCEWDIPIP